MKCIHSNQHVELETSSTEQGIRIEKPWEGEENLPVDLPEVECSEEKHQQLDTLLRRDASLFATAQRNGVHRLCEAPNCVETWSTHPPNTIELWNQC